MTTGEGPSRSRGRSSSDPVSGAQWPAHLQRLLSDLRTAPGPEARSAAMGEAWILLNTLIGFRLRIQVARIGAVAREDLEDIAAQKSLDLLRRAESGEWDLGSREPSELAAFLMTVARNGLVDFLRRSGRLDVLTGPDGEGEDPGGRARAPLRESGEWADADAERREFASALRACAETLAVRTRVIWFLRVFCDLSTREIATHPNVRLNPGHVDVLLHRARRAITACMRRRGHESHDVPPGTFAELWRMFRADEVWRR